MNTNLKIKYNPSNDVYEIDSLKFDYMEEAIEHLLSDFIEENKVRLTDCSIDKKQAILSAVNNEFGLLYYDFKPVDLFIVKWEDDEDINLSIVKSEENFFILEKLKQVTLKEFIETINSALKENFSRDIKSFLKIRDVSYFQSAHNDSLNKLKLSTYFYFSYNRNDVFVNYYRKAPLLKMVKKSKEVGFRTKEMFLYSLEIIDYSDNEELNNLVNLTSNELYKFIKKEKDLERKEENSKNEKEYNDFISILDNHKISKEDFMEIYEKFSKLSYGAKERVKK